MNRTNRNAGYTMAEVVVVAAIMGVLMSMAIPGTQRMITDQAAVDMARTVNNAFQIARVEALRTGNNHVVFLSIGGAGDTSGTPLLDANGDPAAVLILDDGPTGSANQNCEIDPGESTRTISPDATLSWGHTYAGGTKAPGDTSSRPSTSGSSFATPTGGGATWILFRSDGSPVAIDSGCNQGTVGTGIGGIYFTNGERDQAVVLNALGGSRMHGWNRTTGQWTK
jgi:prepilin-type N-terminal cleavage/methylation domain-containing protein